MDWKFLHFDTWLNRQEIFQFVKITQVENAKKFSPFPSQFRHLQTWLTRSTDISNETKTVIYHSKRNKKKHCFSERNSGWFRPEEIHDWGEGGGREGRRIERKREKWLIIGVVAVVVGREWCCDRIFRALVAMARLICGLCDRCQWWITCGNGRL